MVMKLAQSTTRFLEQAHVSPIYHVCRENVRRQEAVRLRKNVGLTSIAMGVRVRL